MFDGVSCYEYGLILCDFDKKGQEDVSFGTKASIVEATTSTRIRPIHLGVKYHEKPLEYKLVFGARSDLDRHQMQNISLWLMGGNDYHWLQICQADMETYLYRCFITELTPITVGWLPYAFEATVRCDCPYAYGFQFSRQYRINKSASIVFRNESTTWEYWKPDLVIETLSGADSFQIINHSDGDRKFTLTGLSEQHTVLVDNANGILVDQTSGENLYGGFNMQFFRMVRGENELEITGKGRLTISGRFLYNIAA